MDAINSAFGQVFRRADFGKEVYGKLNAQFNAEHWESVLEEVLKGLYPYADVQRVGGRSESEHGTDIKISIPGLSKSERHYVIAVQVKDYVGEVGESVIEQINKASYWNNVPGEKLIEKVVIFTRSRREENARLVRIGDQQAVRFVFAEDLEDILTGYAMRRMGLDDGD